MNIHTGESFLISEMDQGIAGKCFDASPKTGSRAKRVIPLGKVGRILK